MHLRKKIIIVGTQLLFIVGVVEMKQWASKTLFAVDILINTTQQRILQLHFDVERTSVSTV